MASNEYNPRDHIYKMGGIVVPGVTDLVSIYGNDMDENAYGDRSGST